MVRELFALAKSKKAAILFFDEVDAIGGSRGDDGGDGDVTRTMLEIVNQLDGFETYFYWMVENKKIIITKQARKQYK